MREYDTKRIEATSANLLVFVAQRCFNNVSYGNKSYYRIIFVYYWEMTNLF